MRMCFILFTYKDLKIKNNITKIYKDYELEKNMIFCYMVHELFIQTIKTKRIYLYKTILQNIRAY